MAYRLAERFPEWIKSPAEFWRMPEHEQRMLIAYETIRQAERGEMITKLGEIVSMSSIGRALG